MKIVSVLSLQKNKKNIVILGGGTCGLIVAKKLARHFRSNPKQAGDYRLILVNKRDVHVYHSDLYEISTAYNKEITEACMSRLENSVCIHLKETLEKSNVEFLQDEATGIDTKGKTVSLKKNGDLPYEYLVVAVGSITNYYNIPGLEENSYPLKTLADAMALNCHVDQFFHERWEKKNEAPAHIVIGGGGATGVEYACELIGYVHKLSKKYKFPSPKINVSIVDGGPELIGQGEKTSEIATRRLRHLGITPVLNTYIQGYEGGKVQVEDQKTKKKYSLPADILIWTGGIKPNLLLQSFDHLSKQGELEVHETLECQHYPKMYSGGDNAEIVDPKTKKPMPKTGQFAYQEGKVIADNIWTSITGKKQHPFQPLFKGYIIPMGGKYYLYHKGKIAFAGIIPYLMRRTLDVMYFSHFMPLMTAIGRIFHKERIFIKND